MLVISFWFVVEQIVLGRMLGACLSTIFIPHFADGKNRQLTGAPGIEEGGGIWHPKQNAETVGPKEVPSRFSQFEFSEPSL